MRALGGRAQLRVLPRARHFPMEDHAAEMAESIAALAR
jgi:pimeloyl-ACP methyl ester carboxylesterase